MLTQGNDRATETFGDLISAIEQSPIVAPDKAARALAAVRDGVITGEGPTTAGRIHFSRSLDAQDTDWCVRILLGGSAERGPVTRGEAEALFEISEAASERRDDGHFDDLFAKAIVHHAAAASGLPVPARAVALSPETPIESWAPTTSVGVDTEVLEWISKQMRGAKRNSQVLHSMIALLIGAATIPFAQSLASIGDLGM